MTMTIRPPFSRMGGKFANLMRRDLDVTRFFPRATSKTCYIEPFVGTCAVGLNYLSRSRRMNASFNDNDGDLINFWVSVQRHRVELESRVQYLWYGMEKHVDWDENDPIDRAALFWMQNLLSTPGYIDKPVIFQKHLDEIASILDVHKIIFFNKTWIEFMEIQRKIIIRHGRWHPIIYLDPPYHRVDNSSYRTEGFKNKDLAAYLLEHHPPGYPGNTTTWFLSINDHPEVREWYRDCYTRVLGTKKNPTMLDRVELLISNRPLIDQTKNNGNTLLEYMK